MSDSLPLDCVVAIARRSKTRLAPSSGKARGAKPAARRGGSNGFGFPPDDRDEEVSMTIAACNEFARANRTCSHSLKVRAPSGLPCSLCLMPVVERVGLVKYNAPASMFRAAKIGADEDAD